MLLHLELEKHAAVLYGFDYDRQGIKRLEATDIPDRNKTIYEGLNFFADVDQILADRRPENVLDTPYDRNRDAVVKLNG